MRPVDAISYRKVLEEELRFHRDCDNREIIQGLEIAVADLGDMPTLEVRPVVHAKWIFVNDKCGCSNCRNCLSYDGNGVVLDLSHLPYCPHCGATMDLKEATDDGNT